MTYATMADWETIVGNIGTVYQGTLEIEARKAFNEYRQQSLDGYGSASGESVTLMRDGEIAREYIGKLDRRDD